jgi:hypothetical protein
MSNYISKFKNFVIRFCLLFVVILWNFLRINNIDKSTGEYKEKLTRNFMFFNILTPTIKDYIEDPSLILLIILLVGLISNILALFGNFKGVFLSAIIFGLDLIVYFNPLLPENKITLFGTRIELFTNIGILLSLLMCAYYPYNDKKIEMSDEEIIENIQEEVKEKKIKKNKK